MPVQHTLFGHTISMPRHLPPARILVVFGVVLLFLLFTLFSLFSSPVQSLEEVKEAIPHHIPDHIPRPKLPKLGVPSFRIPFRHPVHKPPVQANSTSSEANWFSDWRWLHPFSSSITLDENRALLPPLRKRPPVYTFYERDSKKDETTQAAESELLLIWRRAWWAQGFTPIVLGREEAMNNPLYQSLRSYQLDKALESELERWLAWEHMGAGVLANWLALPMGSYDDPLLSYLRKGDYQNLTRYEGLRSGLLCGNKAAVTAALKQALENKELKGSASLQDAIRPDMFEVDPVHQGVAFYDVITLKDSYRPVFDRIVSSEANGLHALGKLINSHLHNTFQNAFSKGIAVLNPTEKHINALIEPGLQIASYLAQCADSPMPASCPPNRPKCKPCVSAHPLQIATLTVYRNTSTLYTIGTVPHPYMLATLTSQRTDPDVAYVRRKMDRDRWTFAATKELLGTGVGSTPRLLALKEAVASEWGSARSLWLTPEKDLPADLDWHFGFTVPKNVTSKGYATPPVPGSKPNMPDLRIDAKPSPEDELRQEKVLLEQASNAVRSAVRQQVTVREMVEAWNLADTEAWRFVRAFNERSRVERLKWEEEEKKFGVGASGGRSTTLARWLDVFR